MKTRLDQNLVARKLVISRSQAESYIKLGQVKVNGQIINKPGHMVDENDTIELLAPEQYVSRAALKLASVAEKLALDFRDKIVLDVGSSTGGFTDFALKNGAVKVIAVDVGTNQLHPLLHGHEKIELHEQTDIRNLRELKHNPDYVVIDVSFISLRDVLPHIANIVDPATHIIAMVKPQFETGSSAKHKGIIKNDHMRRDILHQFEHWAGQHFVIIDKADSDIAGAKGNRERFYKLKPLKKSS